MNDPSVQFQVPGSRSASLQVLLLLGTSTGGVARHVHALASSLVRSGHQVTVGSPVSVQSEFDFTAVGARFGAIEVRERPYPQGDIKAVGAIRRLAKGMDVVHAHGLRAGGLAVLALRRQQVPLVVTLHNALLASGVAGSPVRAAYAVLERLVARGADIVLGASADLEERLLELGATDVRHAVIPAPAALGAKSAPQDTRRALGADDRLLVLCVARLAEQKGLPLLFDAVALLPALLPPPSKDHGGPLIVIAGDGPLRARLAARVEAEQLPIRLLGWRDDVGDLLTAVDLVVSSAIWEAQPVAIQQALHAGAAVVATDVGGTAAVTGDAAVLVPGGDPEALAAAMADLLADPARRDRMRAAARRRAAELPNDAAGCDAALAVYADLRARSQSDRSR